MKLKSAKAAGVAALICTLALGAFALAGCGSQTANQSGEGAAGTQSTSAISVYSREDGSGTRGAFIELFGLEEKDASGNKEDMTTPSAAITNSTSVMMTSIANDPDGIGYISLGSLNDTVKALDIDGVAASVENVKNGTYKIYRPFNIVTTETQGNPAAQDFISFIMSADGQAIVEENNYIATTDSAAQYEPSGAAGKVVVAGSSSVTPVMEKLAEAYQQLSPDVKIEVQQSDSTTGVNMALEGTCDIGMASRELKDSETSAGAAAQAIANDGIVVIVSPDSTVDALTSDQVKAIFSGDALTWADVLE